MPPNFSAVYALVFCAPVFFRGRLGWALPLTFVVGSDLALNVWYQWGLGIQAFTPVTLVYLAGNYIAYTLLFILGRQFNAKTSLIRLIGGGLLGAILFYLVTNSLSWLLNPFHNVEYTRTLAGWIRALTRGVGDWPATWEFFRNSLLSGALFTALFGWAGQTASAESPAEKGETAESGEPQEAGAHSASP